MSPAILDPVTLDAFARDHDGTSPLHVARDDRRHFAALFAPRDLEALLDTRDLHFPDAQLSRHAAPVASGDYTDAASRIVPRRFLQYHADGATVVLSQAHRYWPALAALRADAEALFGRRCQTNLYLTPPAEQGFGPHYDAHDVFILQVAGAKRFRFHAGGPTLPLAHQRFDAASCKPGPAGDEVLLQAGDTLYIPRGVMHDALAEGEASSLHVTLGVFGTSWLDLAIDALQHAAAADPEWRAWVPGVASAGATIAGETGDRTALHAPLRALLARALPDAAIDAAGQGLADALATGAPTPVTGTMARLAAANALTLDDTLVTRISPRPTVERRGDALTVRLPGTVMTVGGATADAVERLLDAGRLRVRNLGGARTDTAAETNVPLAPDACLALARQLIREGLAERGAEPSPGGSSPA